MNIEANCEHENVTALQIAAFSSAVTLEFELASGNLGDHRVRLSKSTGRLEEHTRPTIHVRAAPLDDLVDLVDGALAVKVDTQGAEPFVLSGGRRIFERADLVIMEFWPYGIKRMGANVEEIVEYFERKFDALMISRGDEKLGCAIPIKRAAAYLRRFGATRSDDNSFSVDVIGITNPR
ncbi:MAG: hypothetical protein WCG85_08240 [Polyangia bacterium]